MCRMLKVSSAILTLTALSAAQSPSLNIKFKNIVIPGAIATVATGINNSGVVVGWYSDSSGVFHGFSIASGTVTTIDDPKGTATLCNGWKTAPPAP